MRRRTALDIARQLRYAAEQTADPEARADILDAAERVTRSLDQSSEMTTAEAAVVCGLRPAGFRRVAQLAGIRPIRKIGNESVWDRAAVDWIRDHRPKPGKPGHRGQQ